MATLLDIGIHPQFTGSKKKRRRFERAAKDLEKLLDKTDARVDAYLAKLFPDDEESQGVVRAAVVKARCQKIYQLAQLLESEDQLDLYLGQIPDDELRAETRKLIEPFCRFQIRQPIIAATPAQAAAIVEQVSNRAITPNVDGILPHERDFREHERRLIEDDLPHREQVRAAAHFLARSHDLVVLKMVRDEGFDAFALKARAAQFGLAKGATAIDYTDDDLRWMYAFVLQELGVREGRAAMHVAKD